MLAATTRPWSTSWSRLSHNTWNCCAITGTTREKKSTSAPTTSTIGHQNGNGPREASAAPSEYPLEQDLQPIDRGQEDVGQSQRENVRDKRTARHPKENQDHDRKGGDEDQAITTSGS